MRTIFTSNCPTPYSKRFCARRPSAALARLTQENLWNPGYDFGATLVWLLAESQELGPLRFFVGVYLRDVDRRISKPSVDEIFTGVWLAAGGPDGDGADKVGNDEWEKLLDMLDGAWQDW